MKDWPHIPPGTVVGVDLADEAAHFMTCNACGQSFDMREFSEVAYHEREGHEPRKTQ